MIVTDLSNSFNPYPKPTKKVKKELTKIKPKSNKLAKKEKNRVSILQEDDGKCFVCGRQMKKTDKHEAFGGSYRQKSMEWGLIYYLCRTCHQKADVDEGIRKKLHYFAKREIRKKIRWG